eukprot:109880_1
MAAKDCDKGWQDFEFDTGWWYTALSLCIVFTVSPIYDFTINKSRETPSKLMLGRTLSNFCLALTFLITVKSNISQCTANITCHSLGALFTIFLIISGAYYTTMCVDLYFTLRNPFRKPVSNSLWIHFIVIFIASVITIPIGVARPFTYRDDLQFCWTTYSAGFNFWNLFIVYVPAISVVIGGIIVTYWSLKRLKSRILDDTFELRWKIIKRQTAIVACFTIAYFCQGIIWMITFMNHENEPTRKPPQPYLLSMFVLCGVFFDLITWCAKDSILLCWKNNMALSNHDLKMSLADSRRTNKTSDGSTIEIKQLKDHNQPYKSPNISGQEPKNRPVTARTQLLEQKYSEMPKKKKDEENKLSARQNLSNALRREVITFITAGLVTGVKVTAWETNKNKDMGNTYEGDDFDGEEYQPYGSNYREDTETHPALQLFHYSHSHIDQPIKRKPQAKHYGKAQTYAGYLFDNISGRKFSKSREKRSTDSTNGFSDRHHRGSSYQYQAKIGKTSTVALSIPIGLRYDVKERNNTLPSVHSESGYKEEDEDIDDKYNEYNIVQQKYNVHDNKYSEDITAKRTGTMISNSTDTADMTSSSNETPDISQGSPSDASPSLSDPLQDENKLIVLQDAISSAMDSFSDDNDDDETTMNAENDGTEWNTTLNFDIDDTNQIYSESLLATCESEPPSAYYPTSIKLKKSSTNRGTVNRFNIGIAGSARVSFTDYAPHVFRYLRTEIYNVNDRSYLESILPPNFDGEFTNVSEDIIA